MAFKLCWFTGKRMLTKRQARKTKFLINRNVNERNEGKTIKAVYLCEHCETYHLSSMNQSLFNSNEKRKEKKKTKMTNQVQERIDYLNERMKSKKKSDDEY